ncbi:SPOR domain-containing protein [Ancylomarina longa]|uniref:SPOR domain-containing protein n=1 Tax=Ancylomarina longa TaxID=2487017 RepID=A0A434AFH7_9BACT|nr:SPOR domain-containing protein [Ancylomarina longa]RUT73136.1 SPOR domain-containing protein [Ancylomarina longa]
MSKLNLLFVFLFIFTISCKDKTTITPVKKQNIASLTAKRQVPELTPPPKKPKPKLTSSEVLNNRKIFDYHIIAASYNYKNQATAFKERLYKKGYPSIVLSQKGKYRVVMQSFNNKESAIKELVRLRKLNKKPDLWLLRQ